MAAVGSGKLDQGDSEVIGRQELMDIGRDLGLAPQVVEKDYVLGWMLAGIGNHPEIGGKWVFKGGTCLKKCFFETYRFSEDLDFSVMESAHLTETFLRDAFSEVGEWIHEASGIEVPVDSFVFKVRAEGRYVEGRIGYVGPFGRGSTTPKVKLDLTGDELLALDPFDRPVHHPYTDRPADGIEVRCYAFEEVFAEKVRALAERCRPRDLYDVVHLFRTQRFLADRQVLRETLARKCQHKQIGIPTCATINEHPARGELESEWETMLRHQLAALPPIEAFLGELPAFFEWLEGGADAEAALPMAGGASAEEEVWRSPPRTFTGVGGVVAVGAGNPAFIEQIRMAASNRVCVSLTFNGKTRTVEPYSFRRTTQGTIVFYGYERDEQRIKRYTMANIQGARATTTPFAARYRVEIGVDQPVSAPTQLASTNRSRRPRTQRSDPTYVVACSACGKQFRRSTRDTSMRAHKSEQGYPCRGMRGYLVSVE